MFKAHAQLNMEDGTVTTSFDESQSKKRPQEKLSMAQDAVASARAVLLTSRLNILLVFGVFAVIVAWVEKGSRFVFPLALLGIVPLAERLGYVTEQLSTHTNPTLGALLNATFGNVTELIVSYLALSKGLLRVVQLSLLGSVLSNMLLVLGCAFFAGGQKYLTQYFNRDGVIANSGLLMLGVLALLMPNLLSTTHASLPEELQLSRFCAIILLSMYLAYLYFQLVSHRSLYDEPNGGQAEEEEEAVMSFSQCIVWLTIITAAISVLSDYLVTSIETAATGWHIRPAFISAILLPIVGNAAEHAAAIMFAIKNKMDIAIGVAIGSSTQITVMALPLAVLVAWAMGRPLDLTMHAFETGALFSAVLVVVVVAHDGQSNWLRGLTLVQAYVIMAASFWLHEDKELQVEGGE